MSGKTKNNIPMESSSNDYSTMAGNGFEQTVRLETLTHQLLNEEIYRSAVLLSCWHFLLLEEGRGTVIWDRRTVQCEPGSLLCMPPATNYALEFSEQKAKGILLTIDEDVFRTQILDLLPGNQDRSSSFWYAYYTPRVLPHSVGEDKKTKRLTTAKELMCLAKYLGKGGDPAVAGTALVMLMSDLKRRYFECKDRFLSGHEAFISSNIVIKFRALVEQYFSRQYKVGQYAEMLGVSSRTLIRACKTMTGSTAVAIIHDRVVLEARRQLRRSQRSISEIGYQLGFEDAGYFSRFMKEHTGHSPSEIRQQI